MMNGQMPTSNNMVGMGTQMGQAYSQNMQNPLGNMSSMPNQVRIHYPHRIFIGKRYFNTFVH